MANRAPGIERHGRTALRLGVFAAALLPGAALAQDARGARQFSISPQVRYENDSNVLRLPDFVATPAGLHRSDSRLSPQLAIDIARPIGRNSAFLSGLIGYDFYHHNKQLNRERINLTGGGTLALRDCSINGSVGYSRRQSDLADIFVDSIGRGRNRETSWSPNTGISCGSAGGLSSSLTYGHEDVENSDPFRSYGNYSADTYGAQLGITRPVLGTVGLYTNYRRGTYDNRFLPTGARETVKSYAVGVRVDRQFGRITGHVAGGVSRVESNTPGVRGFRGGTYDVSLDYATARLQAAVGFSRGIQQSNLLGVDYSVSDNLNATVNYRLNQRIGLNAGAFRLSRRLTQSPLAPVTIGNVNDRTSTYQVGASVNVARHIAFDGGVTWRSRRGDTPIFDYNSRILALTIRIR